MNDQIQMPEPFFTASTKKLVVMSLCTFGIYECYWFLKNWQVIKRMTGENLSPGWRSTFAPFWAFSCFDHMRKSAPRDQQYNLPPVYVLAALFLGLNILSWTLGHVSDSSLVSLLCTFSFLPMLPVNSMAEKLNRDRFSDFKTNGFTFLNWFAIVFGGFCALISLGGILIETPSIDCMILQMHPEIAAVETALNPGQNQGDATDCMKKGD